MPHLFQIGCHERAVTGNFGSAQGPDIMMEELNINRQFQFGNDKAYITIKSRLDF